MAMKCAEVATILLGIKLFLERRTKDAVPCFAIMMTRLLQSACDRGRNNLAGNQVRLGAAGAASLYSGLLINRGIGESRIKPDGAVPCGGAQESTEQVSARRHSSRERVVGSLD